uniref:Protein kinase domain-containing protein n=1 Tax=Panagrolaimus sp. PS1159 TaxID=55785 RepID=A0AC35F3G7_9BILA
MTGVKIIKSMIKEGAIFLKTEKSHVYYTLVLRNLNDGAINFSFYPWGKIVHTIYMQNCKNFFVFKALNDTVVQKEMKYKINKFVFVKNYTKSYAENIDTLIQTNPSKINVITASGKIFEQPVVDFDEVTTTTTLYLITPTITERNNISSILKMEVIIPIILLVLILLVGACVYKIKQAKRRKSAKNTPEHIPLREMPVVTQNDNAMGIPATIVFNSDPPLINSNDHPSYMITRTATIYLTRSNKEQPSDALRHVDVLSSSLPSAGISNATRMALNSMQDKLVSASKVSTIFKESQSSTSRLTKKCKRKFSSNDDKIFSNTFPTSSLNEGSLLLDQKEPFKMGQFGTVFKCPYVENGEYIWVAVKIANYTSREASKEAAILSKLSHLNIIKLKTVNMKNGLALVMPLRQGDLKTFLQKEKDKISDYHQIKYCMQISDALRYIISQGFIHGDIKASNILVVDISHIEITDFAKSETIGKGKRAFGTTTHIAVELFISKAAFSCEATDVWSFGVTMWEIFNYGEKNPYEEELNCKNVKEHQLTNYLSDGKRLKIPEKLNINIQRAIQTCWLSTSSERPTFNQLFLTFSNTLPEGSSYALNNVLEV